MRATVLAGSTQRTIVTSRKTLLAGPMTTRETHGGLPLLPGLGSETPGLLDAAHSDVRTSAHSEFFKTHTTLLFLDHLTHTPQTHTNVSSRRMDGGGP